MHFAGNGSAMSRERAIAAKDSRGGAIHCFSSSNQWGGTTDPLFFIDPINGRASHHDRARPPFGYGRLVLAACYAPVLPC